MVIESLKVALESSKMNKNSMTMNDLLIVVMFSTAFIRPAYCDAKITDLTTAQEFLDNFDRESEIFDYEYATGNWIYNTNLTEHNANLMVRF